MALKAGKIEACGEFSGRMNRLVVILILGVVSLNLRAQQDPKFSQNMFLAPYYNPGAVGSADKICLGAAFQ